MSIKGYKSSARKLAVFFKKSRDNWKAKYHEAMYTVKKLKNQVSYLKARKKELKETVRIPEGEISELRAQVQRGCQELGSIKKDLTAPASLLSCAKGFDQIGQGQLLRWVTGSTNGHLVPRDVMKVLVPRLGDKEGIIADKVREALNARKEAEDLIEQAKRYVEALIEGEVSSNGR